MHVRKNKLTIAATALFLISILNVLVFAVITMAIGDAMNGKVTSGHYFLDRANHLTEVSPRGWRINRDYMIAVQITYPLGLVVGGVLHWLDRRRMKHGR